MTELATHRVAADEHELLAGATSRASFVPDDGLSGVPMERVVIDGQRYVAKWLSPELDWVARVMGDTVCRPVLLWELGLYDRVAPFVDATVVGASRDRTSGTCVLLMRDVSPYLLPAGAVRFAAADQEAVLDAMAGLHAGMWGFTHREGLCTPWQAYGAFSPENLAPELARGTAIPTAVPLGWSELARVVPRTAEAALHLATEPDPLVRALGETPQTLVHSDWKGGNLGRRPDGRTILVDWAFPGAGAGCRDLAWYLAVNCDRLPTSKDTAIRLYRDALERRGIETADWFERQLELALVGAFLQMGWCKSHDPAELAWWVDRVTPVAEDLLR
ncbi:MAG: hypothetical protein ABR549_05075 [Mycobacteriales bacterium]